MQILTSKSFVLFCFTVAPMVTIIGIDKNWHVGQENVKFTCSAKANPPAHHFTWIRSVSPKLPSCGKTVECFDRWDYFSAVGEDRLNDTECYE